MEENFFDFMDFMKKPSVVESLVDILLCAVPIWVAVMIGLMIGWSWRPRWTGLVFLGLRSKFRFLWTAPPGFGARRLWLAFTALSAFSVGRTIWSNFKVRRKGPTAAAAASISPAGAALSMEGNVGDICLATKPAEKEQDIVTENDLDHLLHLLKSKDGEITWQPMMERSTPNMLYQAWRHEPEVGSYVVFDKHVNPSLNMLTVVKEKYELVRYQNGPSVLRSRTVFEDATAEVVRDFFWDDEFRPKWDPMLAYVKILEEFPHTGTMIVHWIKKFPFFCSDREYIIGRRIWEAGKTYYCVTKGVPYPELPKHDKPRRVELYFSSWMIRAVESSKGDGLSACEVSLVHYEDMGIPKDVAKLGVRHGMWGTVKKLHSGMRAYQNVRKSEASLSRCALMARITTKISFDETGDSLEPVPSEEEEEKGERVDTQRKKDKGIDWKWIVIGGTIALVCGLHTGTIGKAMLLGAGQRLRMRRR